MRKGVQLLSMAAASVAVLAGCGRVSDLYTNQKDVRQSLEITTDKKIPLKALVRGSFEAPRGEFILQSDEKSSTGRYTRVNNTYIFQLDGNKQWKVELQPDSSLRDENGAIWQHQTHSRSFR